MSTGVDNKKVWLENEKALELKNSTVFIGVDNEGWTTEYFFFIFPSDFNIEISPKNATKHPVE